MKWKRRLAVSLGLLLYALPAGAGILAAQLRVNGLSCPFCAFGIEKKLFDVPGVRDVEVFLDEGRIALTFEPSSEATVEDLERAVLGAGFELSALSLEVDGKISSDQGVRLIAHPRMTFRLFETRAGDRRPISRESLRHIRETDEPDGLAGKTVLVEGSVTDRGSTEPSLMVRSIKSVADGSER